eukprot:UN09164
MEYESFDKKDRAETPNLIDIDEEYYSAQSAPRKRAENVERLQGDKMEEICLIHRNILKNCKSPYTKDSTLELTEQYRLRIQPLMERYNITRLPLHLADEMNDKLLT